MTGIRIAVDVGGTFTDVVVETPSGRVSTKVPTRPDAPEEGAAQGVFEALRKADARAERVDSVIHGATLATNAIIERRGARTALIATRGFRDTLEFAYGQRCDQYDLELTRPEPLVGRPLRFEISERVAADGSVLLPFDEEDAQVLARRLVDLRVESVAVSFMHSYRNPRHELRAREILLAAAPALRVSLSHEICPEIREYDRTSTTVVNAYVQPLVSGYLSRLRGALERIGCRAPVLMILSNGALTSLDTAMRFPVRLVESGPAGGAILGRSIAREVGARSAVALDMGGTTAKVVLLNAYEPRRSRSMEVARAHRFLPGSGFPLRIPVIDLIEIGAGGGSIASLDEVGRIKVGPQSAGSQPGPACYARGGTRATVSDADLLLGRLDADHFAAGTMRLDGEAAESAFDRDLAAPLSIDKASAAAGVCEIVDESMANAVRVHAADHGDGLEGRVLVASGGAAPLHAARVAQKLGIEAVIVPEGAGVGSAHGFLIAPIAYEAVRSRLVALDRFDARLANEIFADLRREARSVLSLVAGDRPLIERRFADMRYHGQGHELSVELPSGDFEPSDGETLRELFARRYRETYGRTIPRLRAEALTWTLSLACASEEAPEGSLTREGSKMPPPGATRQVYDAQLGSFVTASVFRRDSLEPGDEFAGPALVIEDQTTTWVPSGFQAVIDPRRHIVLTRRSSP
jgi:N-methylhydantoinase A